MVFVPGLIIPVLLMIAFVKFNEPDSDKLKIKEMIFEEKKVKLVDLLNKACEELSSKGGDISVYSGYESYQAFVKHLMTQLLPLQQPVSYQSPGAMKNIKAALNELYEIFLPTSDWDDAGGSPAIANEILAIIKEIIC